MKHNKFTAFLAVLCILSLFNVEARNIVTVDWNHYWYTDIYGDAPSDVCVAPQEPTEQNNFKMCRMWDKLPVHSSKTYSEPILVWIPVLDWHQKEVPLTPKPTIKVSIRKITATKPEPMLCVVALAQRRRVMLQYPPAGTVWHVPGGVSQLTSVLRKDGHEVKQRWGHISGLEYLLKQQGGTQAESALSKVRSFNSDVYDLYEARRTFEHVSERIQTSDKFRFERNNVVYQSQHQDGTIRGALNAIADRENNLWYQYFFEVEVPEAKLFGPDVYGISIGDERQLFPGLILASMVKDAIPGCVVIVGGNFFGRMPNPQSYPEFIELFNHLDAVVYAEGFQPLQQIANTLDPAKTSGAIWKNGNEVVVNPRTESPTDFNSLPTPALDGSMSQWAPETVPTLYTSSHCPLACDFCAIAVQSDTFAPGRLDDSQKLKPRAMTPRTIAEHMRSTGAHKFDITDELLPVGHQLELGKELRAIGYEATWQCYLTVTDNLLNPQVAKDLYEAGCRAVQFGLETLSKETILRVHKQWNNPASYNRILQNFRDAGIHTHAFLMVGLPSEPLYEGLRWVGFLEKYGRNILTIKSGRWRPARYAPEVEKGLLSDQVELYPDNKPFQTNRSFRYLNATHSNTKVDAMRDIVEQACRRHWAYSVTSTIPWWVNRSRYTWEEMEQMAKALPAEPDVLHLNDRIAQMRTLVRKELKQEAKFQTWDELVAFAVNLL